MVRVMHASITHVIIMRMIVDRMMMHVIDGHTFMMELKLSSKRIMSEASLATSVPEMPMAKPTSAAVN